QGRALPRGSLRRNARIQQLREAQARTLGPAPLARPPSPPLRSEWRAMPCRRSGRCGAAAAVVGAALAVAAVRGHAALLEAFAGPAAGPAPVRGARLRAAAASPGRGAPAAARRAAVEALRRLEREDQLGRARGGNPRAERQSGVRYVYWCTRRGTWRLRYRIKNGPDKGRQKTPSFRPKDESPEEVERARRAAVEALPRLEREDQLGRVRVRDAEHQSGEKHIVWHTGRKLWRVSFMINNGPDKGRMARPEFLPKDESPEEVERARRAAVEALRRLEEEDQLGRARARDRAEHQSGEEHIVWEKGRKAWRVYFMIENGPDKGRQKTPCFRPRDESPEEVEQARRAAVEALRRLEREDQLGRARGGNPRAERQSGVQNVHWHTGRETWRLRYRIKNGPDKGRQKTPSFRPKDESPEEVERARRAAVEALRRLEEADGALGPGN
ncbi:unnamed protein product, partial [Prorocentrum cordatum]